MMLLVYVLAVVGIIAILFLSVDAWFELRVWLERIHIGRWDDRKKWQQAVEKKARKWLKNSPSVRLTDQTRLVLWDILRGNFRSSTIQSWQDAGLLFGLTDADAKRYVDAHPHLFDDALLPDHALLAYTLDQHRILDDGKRVKVLSYFQPYAEARTTIPYRSSLASFRFVDTLGFVVPFLANNGERELAELQIKEYDDALLNGIFPPHVWNLEQERPMGVHDWSRGIGWYILSLVEAPQLPGNGERMRRLAVALLPLQRPDGGFSAMLFNPTERYESSGTVLAGLLFLTVYELSNEVRYLEAARRVEMSLMHATRRNGVVDYAQGDTKGIGYYSTRFDQMPFVQGLTLYLSHKLNDYVEKTSC